MSKFRKLTMFGSKSVLRVLTAKNVNFRQLVTSTTKCPFAAAQLKVKNEDHFQDFGPKKGVLEKLPTTNGKSDEAKIKSKTKSFDQMPSPKGPNIFGTNLQMILSHKGPHIFSVEQHAKLGPIFRVQLSGHFVVFINHPDLFQELRNFEGQTPQNLKQVGLMHFYQKHGDIERGLFFLEGNEWLGARRSMNQCLIKKESVLPKNFKNYEIFLDSAIEEIFQKQNIDNLSISGNAAILMGRSWSKTLKKSGIDTLKIHKMIEVSFELNKKMLTILSPQISEKLSLPRWTKFEKIVFEIQDLLNLWSTEYLNELLASENPTVEEFGLFSSLINEKNISKESIKAILTDILFLGSHTFYSTINWIVYALGRNPKVQEKIHQEILEICKSKNFSFEHIEGATNLQNSVKESIRIYPAATFTTRILNQESFLGGYEIPPGTLVCLSLFGAFRNPKFFPEPEKFWPDRWLRVKKDPSQISPLQGVETPLAFQPFGVGIRACVGKRITNYMIYLLFGKLLQKYRIETSHVEPIMSTILSPDRDMKLKLLKRNE